MSPFAAPRQTLTWKNDGVFSGGDLVCSDASERPVARFESSNWSASKTGKLELGPLVAAGPGMDEIVCAGVAIVDYKRRHNSSRGGDGGGDGGGGG